jgi:hypothetical protein
VSIPDLALDAATALTKQDPQNPVNWFALALAEIKARKLQASSGRVQNATFETGLSLAGSNEPILLAAAKTFATTKASDYAAILFAKILTIADTNSADRNLAQHYLYMVAIAHDNSGGSVALFNKLIADYPTLLDVFAFASIASTEANNLSDADNLLGKAVAINPTSWEIHLARGMLESASNQADLAISEFKATQGAPGWAMQEMTATMTVAVSTKLP